MKDNDGVMGEEWGTKVDIIFYFNTFDQEKKSITEIKNLLYRNVLGEKAAAP